MGNFIEVLTDQNLLSAVFSTVVVVLISFYLRRKNILKEESKKVISKIILTLALPSLAFDAFMSDFNSKEASSAYQVLGLGICFYLFLIIIISLIFKYCFKNISNEKKDVYKIVIIFGNVTFFTFPIISDIYGHSIEIPSQMMILAFRLFLYSYAFFVLADIKIDYHNVKKSLKKIILNPIVIATVLGMLIWSLQGSLPQVNVNGVNYCVFRFDKSIPFLYAPVAYLSKMCTPLSWILIGVTIGESSFRSAFTNKTAWVLSVCRGLLVPLIMLAIVILLQILGVTHLTKYGFMSAVLMMASPLSIVVNTYSVSFKREEYLVSDCAFLSTIMGIITVPLMIVFVDLLSDMSLFVY